MERNFARMCYFSVFQYFFSLELANFIIDLNHNYIENTLQNEPVYLLNISYLIFIRNEEKSTALLKKNYAYIVPFEIICFKYALAQLV